MTKFQWTDYCGNCFTLTVKDDNSVMMTNQLGILCSAGNVGFATGGNGHAEQGNMVRQAARRGLATLRAVTKLDWVQL